MSRARKSEHYFKINQIYIIILQTCATTLIKNSPKLMGGNGGLDGSIPPGEFRHFYFGID